MAVNRCKSCGLPIPPDRVYCSIDCVGDAMIKQMSSPVSRREYMVQYYMRSEEMIWVEKLL